METFSILLEPELELDSLTSSIKIVWMCKISKLLWWLKEYMRSQVNRAFYQDFFPHMLIYFYRNVFLIMKLSNPPSFRAIRALIASQSMFEIFTFPLVLMIPFTPILLGLSKYCEKLRNCVRFVVAMLSLHSNAPLSLMYCIAEACDRTSMSSPKH